MKKVTNFFLTDKYLKLLTGGSRFITVCEFDIAITKNENVYIKIPTKYEALEPEMVREKTDNVVNYLDLEGFLPKMKKDKRVHVWVYN